MNVLLCKADYSSERTINSSHKDQWYLSEVFVQTKFIRLDFPCLDFEPVNPVNVERRI